MKILLIGKYDQDSFASHISQTLNSMGHITVKFSIGIGYKRYQNRILINYESVKRTLYDLSSNIATGRKRVIERIKKECEQKIDLIICTNDYFYPEQVAALKNYYKCKIIMWYPDAIVNLRKSLFLAGDYDYVFFKEPYYVKLLQQEYNLKNIFYLPECFNPLVHKIPENKPNDLDKLVSDITTAGNLHPYRVKFFEGLQGYNIKIWGNPAPEWLDTKLINKYFQNHYVTNEEKAIVFHYSKIVINNLHPGEIWGINVRAFEIAGCGGFQLISWRPGLNQLFKEGEEIISFKSFNEMKEKIDYYLKNENERIRITENAFKRATLDHTYKKRLNLLLDTIDRKQNGLVIPNVEYS